MCAGLPQACEFPLNQVFATEANNAVNVDITVPYSTSDQGKLVPSGIYGAPLVSFTYSGVGNAYTAGQEIGGSNSLTLQILANSSLYQNNAVIWSVDISDVAVILPTTSTVTPNPILAILPSQQVSDACRPGHLKRGSTRRGFVPRRVDFCYGVVFLAGVLVEVVGHEVSS